MVFIYPASQVSLSLYFVTNWAGDTHDRKSTTTYLIYMGPNAISWSSKKQPTVAKSLMKAEY